jgi:pyruvate dehydrogenase E1 component beta subunit
MSRYLRPAARLAATARTQVARPAAASPFLYKTAAVSGLQKRTYADASGVKEYTVRDALNEALAEELEANDKVFVMGEEVAQYNGAYKVTKGLLDRFGEKRVIDTPITESGFCGLAVGAALSGLHPVVSGPHLPNSIPQPEGMSLGASPILCFDTNAVVPSR